MDWRELVAREEERYEDGKARLPGIEDPDARQKQLARMGNAAYGAGLALLMDSDEERAREWFTYAVERYGQSIVDAPADAWGRAIAAMKSRIFAGHWDWAEDAATWTVEQDAASAESPIARYAACVALLILERDREARVLADDLRTHEGFPTDVADALAMLSAQDVVGYIEAVESVLESFETREEHLEDVPVADTVLLLQALATRRDMAAELSSPLLP
jgi:hypothetical protein